MSNSLLREEFYKKHSNFFHTFTEPGFELDYAVYGSMSLPEHTIKELKRATKDAYKILTKVRDHVLTLEPHEVVKLGFSPKIIGHLNVTFTEFDSVVSRFDAIRTGDSFKFIEINNDTPFLIVENFYMNALMNKELGIDNGDVDTLKLFRKSLSRVIRDALNHTEVDFFDAVVVVMSYSEEEDLEDYLTAKFYVDELRRLVPCVRHVNFKDVRVDMEKCEAFLNTEKEEKINILFKPSYPYEFLIDDDYIDKEGSIGLDLMQLSLKGELALVSTPRAHIMQNKVLFALITKLYEEGTFFDDYERTVVSKYFPITRFDSNYFLERTGQYVIKPVIGREGQSVDIILSKEDQHKSKYNQYDDQLKIFQEYIEPPIRQAIVGNERRDFREVLGVFVAEGEYAGTVIRLGNDITEWDSHWVAVHPR